MACSILAEFSHFRRAKVTPLMIKPPASSPGIPIEIDTGWVNSGVKPTEIRKKSNVNQPFEDTSDYDKDPDRFLKNAKLAVVGSWNSTHDVEDEKNPQLDISQLYIVWFAKVLNNWKALISTSVAGDGLYFEVTYNGAPGREETYVDTYRKEDNQVFSHHDR